MVLSAECDELHIAAGLQDRVIQVYEGLVYMDFDKAFMNEHDHGRYEELDCEMLPPLYIAYRDDLSKDSEVFHNNIRDRFDHGEPEVISAMQFWASLTDEVKGCLIGGEAQKVGELLNANFDRRRGIYKISSGNIRMVEVARSVGASAKFAGSGGAIVGTYKDEKMFKKLKKKLAEIEANVIKPQIATSSKRTAL